MNVIVSYSWLLYTLRYYNTRILGLENILSLVKWSTIFGLSQNLIHSHPENNL